LKLGFETSNPAILLIVGLLFPNVYFEIETPLPTIFLLRIALSDSKTCLGKAFFLLLKMKQIHFFHISELS